ncbi:rhodanese-like domain-containing protein [Mesoplasma chauliocola]|uniref:Rhodanese-like domain-containing protein n=1 Tax=Mesoplasma chauliocola TaxID=216427 RepID=A0A249SME8_9MOLU|nr:rhodanese-like domain-containing protein [Mesoplasma chauliocola]ASZ08864.1 rhodanese-like domain-containing protein [Mesoplasma chauliocola]
MNNYEINKNKFYILLQQGYKIIDVRGKHEDKMTGLSHPDAINIPYPGIIQKAEQFFPDKNEKLIIVCNYGSRSGLTAKTYRQKGYVNTFVLLGGLFGLN